MVNQTLALASDRGRILLVEDEPLLLRALSRSLGRAGYIVETARDGESAVQRLRTGPAVDAVISDIAMPGGGGMDLLCRIHEFDPDLPVVMMTGSPGLDTALRAIEHGAFRYIVKPFDPRALDQIAQLAVQRRRSVAEVREVHQHAAERARLEGQLTRAIDRLWMAYQPIVDYPKRTVFGYEALARTEDDSFRHPGALIEAAERLGRLFDLGRAIRSRVAGSMEAHSGTTFVNLHSADLMDEQLYDPTAPLSLHADRVVLEITERASLEKVADCERRTDRLRALGFRLAIDDLGAGYAGLTSFAQIKPEVCKLDMTLVRDVDREPTRQRIVRSLAALCRELGMLVVAEGVETAAERDTLTRLGCDLLQGYLFARPGRPFPVTSW